MVSGCWTSRAKGRSCWMLDASCDGGFLSDLGCLTQYFAWCQVLVGCWLPHATPILVGRESHAMSGSRWMLSLMRRQVESHDVRFLLNLEY